MGYVVQDGGLYPHLTALDNVTLAAGAQGWARGRIDARVAELATMAGLDAATLARYPRELSGGQRQRVGLMRALMLDPPVLLLDEPLGALDPIVRAELQDQLGHLFATLAKTVVLVTHDIREAARLGRTITLMTAGRVVQHGTFADLVERPRRPAERCGPRPSRWPCSRPSFRPAPPRTASSAWAPSRSPRATSWPRWSPR
jgi:osmoprotectant transport system ATP-binding protein